MNAANFFLIAMVAVVYFFFIIPQMRRSKKQTKFRAELAKGDKVVTTGGIHGKVVETKDLSIVMDVGNGVKLKVDRSAISMEASNLADGDKS